MKKILIVVLSVIFFSSICIWVFAGGPFPVRSISDESGTGIVDVTATGELEVILNDGTDSLAINSDGTIDIDISISQTAGTYAVNVASTASSQLRPANTSRSGIIITNYGAQIVFISTFSTTVTTNLIPLAANNTVGDEFVDMINPYTGAWYAITIAGQAANDVRIYEKTK